MRKKRVAIVAALVTAMALLLALGVHQGVLPKPWKQEAKADNTTVGPEGGTFTFGKLTVTVPKGAVEAETRLDASAPRAMGRDEPGPFGEIRTSGTTFDISLKREGRSIQPKVPLLFSLRLQGEYRPEGANPSQVLMYTGTGAAANPYLWVPATYKRGMLTGKLAHLSPKYLVYLDESAFERAFGLRGKQPPKLGDCKQEVTAQQTGEVKIGGSTRGWSLNESSPIFACLTASKEELPVAGITNRLNYILSVAATSDVELASSQGGVKEELVKQLAGKLFPDSRVKQFVGREGRLVANLPVHSLPATIQLAAEPNTYLSEIGYFAVSFILTLQSGKPASEIAEALKLALDSADVIDCLQQSLDISSGKVADFSFGDGLNLVGSKCFSAIGAVVAPNANLWDMFGRVWQTVAHALDGGWSTIMTAIDGIKAQFGKRITVQVVKPVPPCPSGEELRQILLNDIQSNSDTGGVQNSEITLCDYPWAYGRSEFIVQGTGDITSSSLLLHYEGNTWRIVDGRQAMWESPYCSSVPPAIRDAMNCRI